MTSSNSPIKPELISLVKKVIPEIKECEDCIKIEAMQFQTDKKNAKLSELETKIDKFT